MSATLRAPYTPHAGMLALGAAKILAQAAPILLLAWFSKRSTPEALGVLSFIAASLSILALVSDLGLSDAQNRFLHGNPGLLAPLVNCEWVLTALGGLFVWLSDALTGWALGHGALLGAAVFSSSFYVLTAGLSGLYRLKSAAAVHALSAAAFMALAVLLEAQGLSAVEALLVARVASWGAFDILLLLLLARQKLYRAALKLPKAVWAFALSAFWFHAVELIINQVDVALVRALLGDREAGTFKTASLLGMAPMAFGTLVAAALLPVLVRMHAQDPLRARRLVTRLGLALASLLAVGLFVTFLIGRPVLELFYTPLVAREGYAVFLFSLGATACYVVAMPVQEWLLATDQVAFVRVTATVRAALFFPLATWWGLRWGISGVSAAHLAIYALFLVGYGLRFATWKPAARGAAP